MTEVVTGVTFPPLFIYGKDTQQVDQPGYGNDMRAIEQWKNGIKVTTATISSGGGNIPGEYCHASRPTTAPFRVASFSYVCEWGSITNVGGTGPRIKTTRKAIVAQKTGLYLIGLTLSFELRSGIRTPHNQIAIFELTGQPTRSTVGATNYTWTFTGRTVTGTVIIYRTIGPTYTWFVQLTATQTFTINTNGRMTSTSLGVFTLLGASLFVRRIT